MILAVAVEPLVYLRVYKNTMPFYDVCTTVCITVGSFVPSNGPWELLGGRAPTCRGEDLSEIVVTSTGTAVRDPEVMTWGGLPITYR